MLFWCNYIIVCQPLSVKSVKTSVKKVLLTSEIRNFTMQERKHMKHVAEFYTKILFILCLDLNKR